MDNYAYYLRVVRRHGRVRRRAAGPALVARPTTSSCGCCPTSRSRPTACGPRTTRSATRSRRSSTTCCPDLVPGGPARHRCARRRSRAGSTGSRSLQRLATSIGATVAAARPLALTAAAPYQPLRGRYQASAGASPLRGHAARAPSRRRRRASIATVSAARPSLAASHVERRGRPAVARRRQRRAASAPSHAADDAQRPRDGRDDRRRGPASRPAGHAGDRRPATARTRPASSASAGDGSSTAVTSSAWIRGVGLRADASSSSREPAALAAQPPRDGGPASSETSGRAASPPERAQVGRDPLRPRPRRALARLVEVHVHRERRVGDRVVPALEQALRERPQRLDRAASAAGRRRGDGVGQDEGHAAARRPRGGPARSGGCRGR